MQERLSGPDVPARGRREQDELVARAHRARLMQAGQMLAGIVHEINNPLAVIQGYTQLMQERCTDEVDRRDLERILGETRRLGRLVEDMLAFTRRGSEELETLDLCDVVGSAVTLTTHAMKQAGISVIAALPEGPLFVRGHRGAYVQVLLNLLYNARDSLKRDAHPERGITIRARAAEGSAEVSVEDNGRAIPTELAESIFDPFFTTKENGTGLGLSLCRDILARYEGSIVLDPPNGERGVSFRVVLPSAR